MFGLLLKGCWGFVDSFYNYFYNTVFNNPSFISTNVKIIGLNVFLLLVWRWYLRSRNVQHRKKSTALKPRDMTHSPVKSQKIFRPLLPLNNSVRWKLQHHVSKDLQQCISNRSKFSPPKMYPKLNKIAPTPLAAAPVMDTRDETLDEITWLGDESVSALTDKDNMKLQYKPAKLQLDDICADTAGRRHLIKPKKKDLKWQRENELQKGREICQTCNMSAGEKRKLPSRKELVSVPLRELIRASRRNSIPSSRGKTAKESSPEKRIVTLDKDERKDSSTRSYETKESAASRPRSGREKGMKRKVKKVKEGKMTKTSITKIREKSRKTIEIACDSDHDRYDVDPNLDCSDHQLPRLQSEASLFYKRDSWIWFSSEMKPSGEDFASRQRKFQSRDPRVAELAVEISRQEEMNRDIERTAESLIDSSSASTAKLADMSLRVACFDDQGDGECGTIKRMQGRMHKIKPYNRGASKVLTTSPNSANLRSDFSKQRHSVKYSKSRLFSLARTSLNRQFAGDQPLSMPSPKERKCDKSASPGHLLKSVNFLPSEYSRTRTDSSSSPDHLKHIAHRQRSSTSSSSSHSLYYYSPPDAKIIRRSPISGRYSPLYDNTTLISSAQCSTSSAGSRETSFPDLKFLNQEKPKSNIVKTADELSARQAAPVKKKSYHRVNKLHSPRKRESRKRKHSRSPSKSQSSNKRSESSKVTTVTKSNQHSNSSSSIKDRRSLSPDQSSDIQTHTKQTLDQTVSISNPLSSENVKKWRSPQLVLSTGESESDSVLKDRSGGQDTSYRQGVISKEVNTAVHRLLFDNEKSSSSYSPSSRSKNQCQEGVHVDDVVLNSADGPADSNETYNSQLISSTIREGDCDKLSSKELSQGGNSEQKSNTIVASDDREKSDVRRRAVKLPSSPRLSQPVSKSNNCTQTKKQRLTNIYTRDYYLGKRVTSKTLQNSSKNNFSKNGDAGSSRWKKTDIKWSKTVSLRLYSPFAKSKLAPLKKHMYKYSRHKPKSCLKPAGSSVRHKQARSTAFSDNDTSNQLMAGDTGSKKSMQNLSRCCLLPRQCIRNGNNLHVSSLEELNIFSPQNPRKNTNLRKSFSQTTNHTALERKVNPAAVHTEKKAPLFHAKVNRAQPELRVQRSKLTVSGSTNNSSSNVPYKSCKLSSADHGKGPMNIAQYSFVTQAQPLYLSTYSSNTEANCFRLFKSDQVISSQNHQLYFCPMKPRACSDSAKLELNSRCSDENNSKLN